MIKPKNNLYPKQYYDKKSDSYWLVLKPGEEHRYEEFAPGFNIEYGKNNEVIGIEILNYSRWQGAQTVPHFTILNRDSHTDPTPTKDNLPSPLLESPNTQDTTSHFAS
jgi:uncharacterized protein YuzE